MKISDAYLAYLTEQEEEGEKKPFYKRGSFWKKAGAVAGLAAAGVAGHKYGGQIASAAANKMKQIRAAHKAGKTAYHGARDVTPTSMHKSHSKRIGGRH